MPKVFIIPHYHYKNQFSKFLSKANQTQESFEFYLLPPETENETPLRKTVADYTEILAFLDNQKKRMGLSLEDLLIAFYDGVITASEHGLTNLFIAGANREDPYPCTAAVSLKFISWGILEQKYDYSLQRHALFHLVMCTLIGAYTKVAAHQQTYGCLLDFNNQLVDFNRKLQMGYYLCSNNQSDCYAAMQSERYGKSIIRLGEVLRDDVDKEEVIKIIQNIQQIMTSNELGNILDRIVNGQHTEADIATLHRLLSEGKHERLLQVGKYHVNIGQGQDIKVGDRVYQGLDAEAVREVVRAVLQGYNASDIRGIVRSVLKEDFPNMAQPDHSQSSLQKTILVLASSPKNEARLRLDQEVREIDEGLRRSQQRDKFTLQQRWAVRPDDLRRALLDLNPQIVHFCGHGSGEDGLVLEDNAGLAQLVPTQALANLFKRFATRGLECVVLNACYAEVQANAIAEHIDYVVGMNSSIGDKAAIKFAVGFYDELGAGYSYEDAYHGGCDAIALQGIPEEHIPVLKQLKKKSN